MRPIREHIVYLRGMQKKKDTEYFTNQIWIAEEINQNLQYVWLIEEK